MRGFIVPSQARLPAASAQTLVKVRGLETLLRTQEQPKFVTEHLLHGGMYVRTVTVPPGTTLTSALIKCATVVITCGDVAVFLGDEVRYLSGYNVIPASAGRKQAFFCSSVVHLTMMFPTELKTVAECQVYFTDEHALLPPLSDKGQHSILITGE